MWNLSLSARWWGPLSYLEITLRNTLQSILEDSVGQPRWWLKENLRLSSHLHKNIQEAENFALWHKRGQSPTVDDVVAASSFGLWTNVLHRDNAQVLWRDHLSSSFKSVKRGDLYHKTYQLKKLRDRIAHHEPIFKDNQERHLAELHYVLKVIHEDLPDLVTDWFPGLLSVISGREAAIKYGKVDL